jgi:hypothetical protein
MSEQRPCCAAAAARVVKKLTLLDGFQVGIANLESILKEVADLKLIDAEAIKKELLKRVKIYNYVPSSADYDYSRALFKEYVGQFGKHK